MVVRIVVAAFLLGHAAIHTGYLAPRPPATAGGPAWPFSLDRSWLFTSLGMDDGPARLVGGGLVALTVVALAVAALASVGILPSGIWPVAATLGAASSLALLVVFFHPWLVIGVAIDLALLWAAVVSGWSPDHLAR